jgi:hypothetical protein
MRKATVPSGRRISSVLPGSVITLSALALLNVPVEVRLDAPRPDVKLQVKPVTCGASWAEAGNAASMGRAFQ